MKQLLDNNFTLSYHTLSIFPPVETKKLSLVDKIL